MPEHKQPYMNHELLDYICCPRCRGSLKVKGEEPVIDGQLECKGCGACYEVVKGTPVLLADIDEQERFTGKNFSEQWAKFNQLQGLGEEFEEKQFFEYFHPFDTSKLAGKTVLEAGCGYGRNLGAALRCGASLAIGFDVGEAAIIAKQKGYDAVIGDILNPPFCKQFDMVFSFGVMHHVSDPDEGLRQTFSLVKPEGMFCHSVYSAENNEFLEKYFTPLRIRFFRHWSSEAKFALATVLGWISFAIFSLLYVPFSWSEKSHNWATRHLFYYDYMILTIKKMGMKQWIGQLYDHFNAPVVAYVPRIRVEGWMNALGLENTYIHFRNQNTWNFGGAKSK